MTYSEKLKDPRWQKKRLEVLNRDDFTCTICNDDKTELNVHHEDYNCEPWDVDISLLNTLCKDCHSFLHDRLKIEFTMLEGSDLKIVFSSPNAFITYKDNLIGKIKNSMLIGLQLQLLSKGIMPISFEPSKLEQQEKDIREDEYVLHKWIRK